MTLRGGRRSGGREYLDLYSALSRAQALIFTAENENELFDRLCELAVGIGQISTTFVALLDEQDQREYLRVVAQRGGPTARIGDMIAKIELDPCVVGAIPAARAPLARAVREGVTVVIDVVDEAAAIHQALTRENLSDWIPASYVAIPIRRHGIVCGVMLFSSFYQRFFSGKIVGLLEALERGLSFALDRFAEMRARTKADENLRLAATVFQSSAQGIAVTHANGEIAVVNPVLEQMTGYTQANLVGLDVRMLMFDPNGDDRTVTAVPRALDGDSWQGELSCRRRDGSNLAVWLNVTVARDAGGEVLRRIYMYSDLSERKAAVEKIEYLAGHDQLTGLPNRVLLKDCVTRDLREAEANGQKLALLFVGLDRFKNVNDSLGHAGGDDLLKQASYRLAAELRSADTVARVGGDEFLLCLPQTSSHGASRVADKIHQRFGEEFLVHGQALRIGASIGVAIYPDDGAEVEALIRNADTAMHAAKSAGRNTLRFYAADMNRDARQRLELESELRLALNGDDLRLYFQPQYDLAAGRLTGWEALVRWPHPSRGMVMPGQFIEIAEESGLIVQLGDWTIRTACRQLREWLNAGLPPVPISINLSARQFLQSDLPTTLAAMLSGYQIESHLLRLEITEGVLMHGAQQTIEICEQLQKMGIGLSIDDFGTGYSSLSYLRRFPIEELKIDQSFTRDLGKDRHADAIVQTIIALAKNLEIMVIAEGVETAEQAELLLKMGCGTGQGYLYSPAIPAIRAADLVRDQ
jgi:diguanylate cyclase (GGDEF)-like protein/PAS domain S-box-containing protein